MRAHFDHMIRVLISDALGIDDDQLPCFVVDDHDGQPMTILLRDEPHAGSYQWSDKKGKFVKLINPHQ